MNTNFSQKLSFSALSGGRTLERGAAWGMMIIVALLAFEIFNFSSTDFALQDVLGDLNFFGVRWATILAIAFCGIDFAGVARLFTPEQGNDAPAEVWYLFGAWLLAAVMNATLTWWGVSVAIANNGHVGNAVVSSTTMIKVVPIFVAVMVWLIRVLIIGTFSIAGERLFSQGTQKRKRAVSVNGNRTKHNLRPQSVSRVAKPHSQASKHAHSQPTYHNLSASSARQRGFESHDALSNRELRN